MLSFTKKQQRRRKKNRER